MGYKEKNLRIVKKLSWKLYIFMLFLTQDEKQQMRINFPKKLSNENFGVIRLSLQNEVEYSFEMRFEIQD